jgi:hypothetical protein
MGAGLGRRERDINRQSQPMENDRRKKVKCVVK